MKSALFLLILLFSVVAVGATLLHSFVITVPANGTPSFQSKVTAPIELPHSL
jgi:hypothetical protein